MTKRHFEIIASRINQRRLDAVQAQSPQRQFVLMELAGDLADEFASINERFDRKRFMAACGF